MNAPKLTLMDRRSRISNPNATIETLPPQQRAIAKPDVEKALIGAVLLDPSQFPRAAALVQAGDFADFWHGMIWYAFEELAASRTPIDLVIAADKLKAQPSCPVDKDLIDYVLASFESACGSTPDNAPAWAEIVRDAAQRLRLISACEATIKAALDDRKPLTDTATGMIRTLSKVVDTRQRQQTVEEGLKALIGEFEAVMAGGVRPLIPTTFPVLDRMIGGFVKGEVAILAGDSGMGKTTVLLSMILSLIQLGVPVTLFSIEMDMAEVLSALVAMYTGISRRKLRERMVSKEEFAAIQFAYRRLRELPLHIDTSTRLTVTDTRLRLLSLNLEAPLGLVVIDGLWKMSGEQKFYHDGERTKYAEIMGGLTALAKDADIGTPPILITHQYNTNAHGRLDKRPVMHDLAESASVRRDAQMVLGLYNAAYYSSGRSVSSGESELHVLKLRNSEPPRECATLNYDGGRYVGF